MRSNASRERHPRDARGRRIATFLSVAVAVAGLGFVAEHIAADWSEARRVLADASPLWLAAAVGAAAAGMSAIAVPWRRALRLFDAAASRSEAIRWYFVGEIGKYVPGGVWPVVGRAELARRRGISRGAAYGSVVLSLGAVYLAALVVLVALLPVRFGDVGGVGLLWLLLLLPLGIFALHHRVLELALRSTERLLRRPVDLVVPRWGASISLVLLYLPAWLLIGLATWCVGRAFAGDAPLASTVFATALSWVAGFVVVPVPGGLGVREAVFVATVDLTGPVAATTALAARLAFMLTDAVGAVIASVWSVRVEAVRGASDVGARHHHRPGEGPVDGLNS